MKLTSTNINEYLSKPTKKFKIMTLPITNNCLEIIDNIKLPSDITTFDYFGNYKDMNLCNQLDTLGDNTKSNIKMLEKIIKNITKIVLKGYNYKYFWMSIRITNKDDYFDVQRWHHDGKHFQNRSDMIAQSKFIMVLKGDGTLLLNSTKKEEEYYLKMIQKRTKELSEIEKGSLEYNSKYSKVEESYRLKLSKKFKNSKITTLSNNEGLVFITHPGKFFNFGAIHSEPVKDKPRLFISILPGTKEEIEIWKSKCKQ
jgi:hypothetical protein